MSEVRISMRENGPLVIEGGAQVVDAEGNVLASGERLVLCRCGHSETKPLCDGSHKRTDFRAAGVRPQRKPDRP